MQVINDDASQSSKATLRRKMLRSLFELLLIGGSLAASWIAFEGRFYILNMLAILIAGERFRMLVVEIKRH
jgi:hypothetical protein